MRRTRVKICGITRSEDARCAARCGADALGLVRVAASPRYVSLSQARAVRQSVRGMVHWVLLFLDPDPDDVRASIQALAPSLLQFHGHESAPFCQQFGVPWIKALSQSEFARRQGDYADAELLLIDSHLPGGLGGTGQRIDDEAYPADSVRPLLLAGGLGPDNVAQAIARFRPYGVDASSGLESEPGIKDGSRLERFFDQVRRADRTAAAGSPDGRRNS